MCGIVLRLRQFDSIVLIGCRIAGCSAAKSPTEKFDYTSHVKNNEWPCAASNSTELLWSVYICQVALTSLQRTVI